MKWKRKGIIKKKGYIMETRRKNRKRKLLNLKFLKAIYINSPTFQEDQDGNFWEFLDNHLRKKREEGKRI